MLGDPDDSSVLAAQNHLLAAVSRGCLEAIDLLPEDDASVAELNARYPDLPGDFADPTLLTLSERLDVAEILTLSGAVRIQQAMAQACRAQLFSPCENSCSPSSNDPMAP